MYFPLILGVLSLLCYVLLCVHFSFAIILKRKRKLVALLLLSYRCIVTKNVLWLFLTVLWVGLQYVIVVFPGHNHLLFFSYDCYLYFQERKSFNNPYLHSGLNCKNLDTPVCAVATSICT